MPFKFPKLKTSQRLLRTFIPLWLLFTLAAAIPATMVAFAFGMYCPPQTTAEWQIWLNMFAVSVLLFGPPVGLLALLAAKIMLWVKDKLWSREAQMSELCATCGYNLRANESGRCPECGARTRPIAWRPAAHDPGAPGRRHATRYPPDGMPYHKRRAI